jgi:hypothetical protein
MTKEQSSIAAAAIILASAAAIAVSTFAYPDEWSIPLPVADAFGPFIGIRMGVGECIPFLLVCLLLIVPIAIRQNILTITTLVIGLSFWGFCGYVGCQWLGA